MGPDSPVAPLLAYRPNCMFADGADHPRLRQAVTDSMAKVDTRRLSRSTEQISGYLIAQFRRPRSADLLGDYAKQLPLFVFNELFGCPADIGDRVLFGISGMFDGVNADKATAVLFQAVGELVALKRSKPGDDVTSWLMQHEAGLTDEEMGPPARAAARCGRRAAAQPHRQHAAPTPDPRAVRPRRRPDRRGPRRHAVGEPSDVELRAALPGRRHGTRRTATAGGRSGPGQLRRGQHRPRTQGVAPGRQQPRAPGLERRPARLPSKEPARHITVTAIEHLFNELPDVELAVPEDSPDVASGSLQPGPGHLPARFTPVRSGRRGDPQPGSGAAEPDKAAGPARPAERSGMWSQFLQLTLTR